ncbi:MAG: glucose 1-dehydrogenase [Nevskia sp.]|uniref:glucose 1-dehydrogenase n=1 Tax=Nevskia sp. TaxID=1929292 RepID=UPI0040355921
MKDYGKAFRVDGKVALISGGARGLGAEMAMALAQQGATILVTDILAKEGKATVKAIKAAGGTAEFLTLDVVDEAQWQKTIASCIKRFGGLDILVNNAGIERTALVTECTVEEFRRIQDINVTGVFLGCKHAVRAMRPGGKSGRGGSIINLSSVAGLVGVTGLAAYNASKGAVRLLTKSVALECAQLKTGIRVNSIHPGVVWTDMGRDLLTHFAAAGLGPDVPAVEAAFLAAHPIGHFGAPDDIASAVIYLASDASKWVTGAEFAIDGGYTAA